MSTSIPYPRASLLGLPPELLDDVVQLAAPSTGDHERISYEWYKTLHQIAEACSALHRVAKPLRRRHVVLSVPATIIQLDELAHYVHLESDGRPVVVPDLSLSFGSLRSPVCPSSRRALST